MKIHHIGFVVKDIEKYRKNLVVDEVIKRVYDPIQKANLELINSEGSYIELIEPTEESAFTYKFMNKGGGYHHLCYEVENKTDALAIIAQKKMIKVLDFVYAPLLDAEVIFAYNRNKEVVEFVVCPKR